jgi:adenylyltransferase/sulfurtransferase
MEVLKLLLDLPGQLDSEVLLIDLLVHGQRRLAAPRNPACAGRCVRIDAARSGPPAADVDVLLPLAAAVAAGYRIVDIREPMECAFEPLPVAGQQSLPLARLLEGGLAVEPGRPYLLVCAHGVRSHAAAEYLRARGHANVWSLAGGLAAQAS